LASGVLKRMGSSACFIACELGRHGVAWVRTDRHGGAAQGKARQSWLGGDWSGESRQGVERLGSQGMAWRGVARWGSARYGGAVRVRHGEVGLGRARLGGAPQSRISTIGESMKVEVHYRNGHANKHVSAAVVYEEIEEIKKKKGGTCNPKDYLEVARPKNSRLHTTIDWDIKRNAQRGLEEQARRIITSYYIVETSDDQTRSQRYEPANVSIATPYVVGKAYVSTKNAMADPETRESVINQALAQQAGWIKRCEHLFEIRDFVADVSAALDKERSRRARKVSA
jgi:hypothetical protein